jgi:hypothetical protein
LKASLERAQKQVTFAGRVIDITARGQSEPVYFDLEA